MIHIENLTKYYGTLCAVNDVTLDIQKGAILGLLGPNGAGKTSMLRMLTGFLRPSSGAVYVKDFNVLEHPLEIKSLMGYLPESAPLYNDMLAYDYLNYVADIRCLKKDLKLKSIRKMVDLCGLHSVMHQPIGELSKGYKQRVGLAHAMISDPEILILDEPTSGLDPNQIIEIRDIIKEIGKEKTVILSTHILNEAEATCDRVVIINRGKIAADGSAETLKRSTDGESVLYMTLQDADLNALKEKMDGIPGIQDIVKVESGTGELSFKIECRSKTDLRPEIYQRIRETDWNLLEMRLESKSLENIFQELTKEN